MFLFFVLCSLFFQVNVHHIVTGMLLCIPAAASFSLINFPNTEKSSYSKEIDIIKDAKSAITLISLMITNWFHANAVSEFI